MRHPSYDIFLQHSSHQHTGRKVQVEATNYADVPKPLQARPVFRMPSLPASMSPSSSQNETISEPSPTQLARDDPGIRNDLQRNTHLVATLGSLTNAIDVDGDVEDYEDYEDYEDFRDIEVIEDIQDIDNIDHGILMPLAIEEPIEEFDYYDDMTLMPLDLRTTVEDDEDDYAKEIAEATRLSLLESNIGGSNMNVDDEEDDPDLAEAIRLSRLDSTPLQRVSGTHQPVSPLARSIAPTYEVGRVPDRDAIARARVRHLAQQHLMEPNAVLPPRTPLNTGFQAVNSAGTAARTAAGTTAARTVTVIDLTDD